MPSDDEKRVLNKPVPIRPDLEPKPKTKIPEELPSDDEERRSLAESKRRQRRRKSKDSDRPSVKFDTAKMDSDIDFNVYSSTEEQFKKEVPLSKVDGYKSPYPEEAKSSAKDDPAEEIEDTVAEQVPGKRRRKRRKKSKKKQASPEKLPEIVTMTDRLKDTSDFSRDEPSLLL